MAAQGESSSSSAPSIAAARSVRDIAKELKSLLQSAPEGIRLLLSGDEADCISSIHVELDGPVGTPYEGGVFRMKLDFGADFPTHPPTGHFLTRIFHPNIAKNGEICVNTLKRDWKPTLGLRHVLLVIRCLLIEPNPESALNEEAGKLLLEDYAEYAHHARLMTSIHAVPKQRQEKQTGSQNQPEGGKEQGKEKEKGKESASSSASASASSSSEAASTQGSVNPLGQNSSIANAEASEANGAKAEGGSEKAEGVGAGAGAGLASSGAAVAAAEGAKGGGAAQGASAQKDKKKVDSRKKALKRL